MALPVRAVVRHVVVDGVAIPAAVVAGAERLVADLPVLDADRLVPIDRQVGVQGLVHPVGAGPALVLAGRRGPEACPVAGRLPVVTLLVNADDDVAGRAVDRGVRVGVGDPGGGLLGLPAVVGDGRLAVHQLQGRAVVDRHHRPAVVGAVEEPDEAAEVVVGPDVPEVVRLPPPGGQAAARDAALPLRPGDRPMVDVGVPAAAEAHRGHAGLFQAVVHDGGAHVVVVGRRVDAQAVARHRGRHTGGVDRDVGVVHRPCFTAEGDNQACSGQ